MKKNWSNLDHRVRRLLKTHNLTEKKIIVCVSGGGDSVSLLHILLKVHKKELLSVFHYHHGPGDNLSFRDQAFDLVALLAKSHQIPFISDRSEKQLKNEMECRKARRNALKKVWSKDLIIATGHHAQDLLETRLIRLIRGTGSLGLKSMSEWKSPWFRPLLKFDPKDLKNYLKSDGLAWLDDPTNFDKKILRNWMRHRWIPQLEKMRPGAQATLARSLDNLVVSLENSSLQVPKKNQLSRSYYLSCTLHEQRELLSRWFYSLGIRDYSQAQIEEIQRQLDKSQNVLIIKVGRLSLKINAQQILLIQS